MAEDNKPKPEIAPFEAFITRHQARTKRKLGAGLQTTLLQAKAALEMFAGPQDLPAIMRFINTSRLGDNLEFIKHLAAAYQMSRDRK